MAIFRSGIDLLATIIVPACLLGYWNFNTQTIIKRRAKIILANQIMRQTMTETIQIVDDLVEGN